MPSRFSNISDKILSEASHMDPDLVIEEEEEEELKVENN